MDNGMCNYGLPHGAKCSGSPVEAKVFSTHLRWKCCSLWTQPIPECFFSPLGTGASEALRLWMSLVLRHIWVIWVRVSLSSRLTGMDKIYGLAVVGVQIGVCHSEFEFLHLLCEKNNIHPIIIIRAVRHLALRSEASKPAQIGTEPSLFIFQTSPSSLIPTFLASSLLRQGCILKLRERWKFPERCLSLFTVSRRPLRCRQWVELPGSQVCVIVSVCTPLLMLPLWAPLLPSRVKSSPNVHLLWAHVVVMCSFSEDLEGQRKAKRQKGSSRQGWWAPWCCVVQILSTMYELCDRRTWSSLQGSVCKEE